MGAQESVDKDAATFDEIKHWKDFPYPLFNYPDPLRMFGMPSSDKMAEIFGPDLSKVLIRVLKEMSESCQGYASIHANLQAAFLHKAQLKEEDKKAVMAFLQTVRFSARDLKDSPEGSILTEWENATKSDGSGADEQAREGIKAVPKNLEGSLEQNKGPSQDFPKLVLLEAGALFGIQPLNETLRKDYGDSAPIVARVAEDIARVNFRSYLGDLAIIFRDKHLNLDYFKDRQKERDAIALVVDRILEATEEARLDKRPTIFEEWSKTENDAEAATSPQPYT